jgi:protein-S-isoprenylcysteine O-methyltransferase Ste14
MMASNVLRKRRTMISRLFSIIIVVLLITSASRWEGSYWDGIIFFAGVVLAAVAIIGRLWCTVYIAGYKSDTLVTVGPYSMCRNPLYFFSLLGMTGVGLASETFTIPLLMLLFYSIYYPLTIAYEERKLARIHGNVFAEYCTATPRFFPSFKSFKEPTEYKVNPAIFRKSMFDASWFLILIGIMEMAESLHESGVLKVIFSMY